MKMSQRKRTGKNLHIKKKKLSDTSPLSKFKDKMLEADSNLQRSTTLFQGIENMLALYMLYERIK